MCILSAGAPPQLIIAFSLRLLFASCCSHFEIREQCRGKYGSLFQRLCNLLVKVVSFAPLYLLIYHCKAVCSHVCPLHCLHYLLQWLAYCNATSCVQEIDLRLYNGTRRSTDLHLFNQGDKSYRLFFPVIKTATLLVKQPESSSTVRTPEESAAEIQKKKKNASSVAAGYIQIRDAIVS